MRIKDLNNIYEKYVQCSTSAKVDYDKLYDLLTQKERDIIINGDVPRNMSRYVQLFKRLTPVLQDMEIERLFGS